MLKNQELKQLKVRPKTSKLASHPSSFRDPAGFVFEREGVLYRQINLAGQQDFDHFIASGLYDALVAERLIVAHQEVSDSEIFDPDPRRYKVIRPTRIPFISYPYEWTFSQLKEAALLTLKIQQVALNHGMILKDASAYNVQFIGQQAIFIDTLSFKIYKSGAIWEGYKQFCEHFIAPLSLAAYNAPEILRTLRVFLDGIPLPLASRLLPARTRLSRGLLTHVHLHAASQKRYDSRPTASRDRIIRPLAMKGLLASLEGAIRRLKLPAQKTQWGDYYTDTNYSQAAFNDKKKIVSTMLQGLSPKPQLVWDMGANDGTFSELASGLGAYVVAFDIDSLAVEHNYRKRRPAHQSQLILPLVQDLANPSPALGWAHSERVSLRQRGPADTIMALALVHHLALSDHLPLPDIASFFQANTSRHLIIEFIPRNDSKVQLLLHGRANLFSDYDTNHFEKAFAEHFKLVSKQTIQGSERAVYLYKAKEV